MSDETKMITLTIDGEQVTVPEGTTIMQAAQQMGKVIPTICYHDKTTPNALCRVCVVDVNKGRLLQPACIALCQNGANVELRNERVDRARRTILEMLGSAVDLSEAPEIQVMMEEYGADPERFPDAKRRVHPEYNDNPFYVRDYSKCVLCWRCVQVCGTDAQYVFALSFGERGFNTHIATAFDVPMPSSTCVFCGQCMNVCPTDAIKPRIEWGLEHGMSMEDIQQTMPFQKRPDRNPCK